jgi:hypothetical protein
MKEMAGMCEESFMVPIITMFFNDAATFEILDCKRSERISRASFLEQQDSIKRLPWYLIGTKFVLSLKLRWAKLQLQFSTSRYQPNSQQFRGCLQEPEFQFLKYLHAVAERMSHWSTFAGKNMSHEKLPQEFHNILGPSDPPLAEYSHLVGLQEFADAYISPKMQQTLFIVMLAERMNVARPMEPPHRA